MASGSRSTRRSDNVEVFDKKVFDSKTKLPIIGERPIPPSYKKLPRYKGEYFFVERVYHPVLTGGKPFDPWKFFTDNKEVGFTIVGSTETETAAEDPAVASKKHVQFIPISSMWQSKCGRYFVYPRNYKGFPTAGPPEIDFCTEMWLPSAEGDWPEYYCAVAWPGRKYNFRNRE